MTAFRADKVSVTIDEHRILDRVSVTIKDGELVGLIGPNGAGKTTLVRALLGLQALSGGRVTLDGAALAGIGARTLARRLAYLPQGAVVHWPLTVERLVALGRLPHLSPLQRPGAADRAAIERALAAADVADLAERLVTTLSGGERMRALVARALAVEPEILLADEPVAALDPLHQLSLMNLLRDLARRGGAVVVVLHDLSLAARFCDRVVLLHEGAVLAQGTPAKVMTAKTLRLAYGIEAMIGRKDKQLYVLPWRIVEPKAPRGTAP